MNTLEGQQWCKRSIQLQKNESSVPADEDERGEHYTQVRRMLDVDIVMFSGEHYNLPTLYMFITI